MLTERIYGGEFLISEASGTRSREEVTFAQNQTLKAGSLIGQVSIGALSALAAAKAGNTGNGTMSAVTVAAGTPDGVYQLEIIEPGTNAGVFRVEDPNGVEIGHGSVGSAFSAGGLGFTLSDGATDFVSGDGFTITVSDAAAADEGQWKAVSASATDGSQHAAGIAWDQVVTGSGETQKGVAIRRDAEVDGALLDYAALNSGQKTTAQAELAALGIIIRT